MSCSVISGVFLKLHNDTLFHNASLPFRLPSIAMAPLSQINGALSVNDPMWMLNEEWAEVRSILSGPPPQCTHPAIMRRWQMLIDLYHPDAMEFMYPASRWLRVHTDSA